MSPTPSFMVRSVLTTCVVAATLVTTSSARAQSVAVDPSTAPADDPAAGEGSEGGGYRFDGRGVWLGAGPGLVAGPGEEAFAARIHVVFPVATEWFAIEGGLLGHSFTVTDHHGASIDSSAGAITAGARFALPPDSVVRPYAAARVAHLHLNPDPYGDHVHERSGEADHESHHRWGAGGAVGLDVGIPDPASRFRLGLEAEALALTGPGDLVLGQIVALFGVGF